MLWQGVDGREQLLRARVHGLAAGHDDVRAKRVEDGRQSLAGRHGDHAAAAPDGGPADEWRLGSLDHAWRCAVRCPGGRCARLRDEAIMLLLHALDLDLV